jgi:SAM-dependent methyltransferase
MSGDRVADRWGDPAFTHTLAGVSWMASTAVLMHLNERATGDRARDWLSSWAHRWFPGKHLRVLVLGCGEGWLERAIASWPFVERIDAVDLSSEAIERAKAQAPPKVTYAVRDLNRDTLEENAYDVVVAHMILHHVENLEHALAHIERAMKRDATLIVNEYAGPKRFQFSDDVLSRINALMTCLPARLRRSALEAKTYEKKERPALQLMIDLDPSEAVRSDELVPMIGERFEIMERRGVGGTLLQHLLYDIVQNFRFEAPKERAMIELMCEYEAMLIDRGAIPCDFVICVARKRGSRATKTNRPLPPRPEAALDVDHDPLWKTGALACPDRQGCLSSTHLRVARILAASRQSHRANLFSENPIAAFLAKLRRADLRFDPNDEDDRSLLALGDAIHSAQ